MCILRVMTTNKLAIALVLTIGPGCSPMIEVAVDGLYDPNLVEDLQIAEDVFETSIVIVDDSWLTITVLPVGALQIATDDVFDGDDFTVGLAVNSGLCNRRIYLDLEHRGRGTLAHEIGHALGLEHVSRGFDNVMYPGANIRLPTMRLTDRQLARAHRAIQNKAVCP